MCDRRILKTQRKLSPAYSNVGNKTAVPFSEPLVPTEDRTGGREGLAHFSGSQYKLPLSFSRDLLHCYRTRGGIGHRTRVYSFSSVNQIPNICFLQLSTEGFVFCFSGRGGVPSLGRKTPSSLLVLQASLHAPSRGGNWGFRGPGPGSGGWPASHPRGAVSAWKTWWILLPFLYRETLNNSEASTQAVVAALIRGWAETFPEERICEQIGGVRSWQRECLADLMKSLQTLLEPSFHLYIIHALTADFTFSLH